MDTEFIAFRGSKEVHKQVKVVSAQTGKTIGKIYEEALRDWLKKNKKSAKV